MTTRETSITKALLDFLHSLEGGQATEIQIHAGICAAWPPNEAKPSAGEVEASLKNCDAEKWITGIPARFNKCVMKWNLNDAGAAARLEM